MGAAAVVVGSAVAAIRLTTIDAAVFPSPRRSDARFVLGTWTWNGNQKGKTERLPENSCTHRDGLREFKASVLHGLLVRPQREKE